MREDSKTVERVEDGSEVLVLARDGKHIFDSVVHQVCLSNYYKRKIKYLYLNDVISFQLPYLTCSGVGPFWAPNVSFCNAYPTRRCVTNPVLYSNR